MVSQGLNTCGGIVSHGLNSFPCDRPVGGSVNVCSHVAEKVSTCSIVGSTVCRLSPVGGVVIEDSVAGGVVCHGSSVDGSCVRKVAFSE